MARPILVACAQGPRTVLEVPFRSKLTAGCRAGSVPARQNRPLRPGGPQLDSYLITTLRLTYCGTRIYGYRCTQGLEGVSLRHLTERSKNKLAGLNAHAAYNWRCIAASSSRRYVVKLLIVVSLLVCTTVCRADSSPPFPFRDTKRPIEERITDLINRLTLEEKAQQLNHTNHGLPRLGIPMWGGWNQTLHGVWSKQPTTLFPAAIAMGATWDPELVHRVAVAMSDEARALYNAKAEGPRTPHGLVFRSPVINISRDPRWGRIQEVFSEDPWLTGRMAVAYVRGLQGDDLSHLTESRII